MNRNQVKILQNFIYQISTLASEAISAFADAQDKTLSTNSEPTKQLSSLLNKQEIADRINVSVRTIGTLQTEGMPAVKIGKRVLFDYEDVLDFLKSRKIKKRRKI